MANTIYTIGHSTRKSQEFIELLLENNVQCVVDVRRFPGSKKFPHFSKENLSHDLLENQIEYHHIVTLGGRRKPVPNSKNTAWRLASFQAYADYMETEEFSTGIDQLIEIAKHKNAAIMCAEAVWWSCHRALISDYLKWKEWKVIHIMGKDKIMEHPWTKPAKIIDGRLCYC